YIRIISPKTANMHRASHSAHVHATVHRHRSSSDIGSTVRSQESDDLGNFFRLTETPQRNLPQQGVTLSFRQLARHVRIDESRRNRVHSDAPRAHLARQGTTETLQPRLSRGVVYLPGVAHGTNHR